MQALVIISSIVLAYVLFVSTFYGLALLLFPKIETEEDDKSIEFQRIQKKVKERLIRRQKYAMP